MLAAAGLALLFLGLAPGTAPLRLTLILNFALAYLGACTLERWRSGEGRRAILLLVAAALAGLLVWAYLAHPAPGDPGRLAILRFGWLRWQLRFLVTATLLLLAGRGQRWMPPLVAVFLAGELLLAHRPANPPAPRRLLFPVNDAVRFLLDHLREDRMAALGPAFPPNLPSLYGLADARIYNPAAPLRYVQTLAPITVRFQGEIPELGNPADPLYRRLGVRYLLVEPASPCPPSLATAFRDATAAICEISGPLPRLYLLGRPGGPALDLRFPEEDHLAARLPAGSPGPSRLTGSVYQDGGWRVLADGRRLAPAAAAEMDGPFVGALLPAGTRRIDLLYRPVDFLAGCLLAALALTLGMSRWCPPPRMPLE
jgi:hypothetical protein